MWLYGIVIGRCDCYKSTFDPCDNDGTRMVSDMLGLENLTPLSQMGSLEPNTSFSDGFIRT